MLSRLGIAPSQFGGHALPHPLASLAVKERELTVARAKIGELMMRLELVDHLIEKRGLTDEWKRTKR